MTDWLSWLLAALEEEDQEGEEEDLELTRRAAVGERKYSQPGDGGGREGTGEEGRSPGEPAWHGEVPASAESGGAAESPSAPDEKSLSPLRRARAGDALPEGGEGDTLRAGTGEGSLQGETGGKTTAEEPSTSPAAGRGTSDPETTSRAGETPADRLWKRVWARGAEDGGKGAGKAGGGLAAVWTDSAFQEGQYPPAGTEGVNGRTEGDGVPSVPEHTLGALDLSEAARRARAAVEEADRLRQAGPIVLRAPTDQSQPPGAAELDRLFQRDARRYDGGFTLY